MLRRNYPTKAVQPFQHLEFSIIMQKFKKKGNLAKLGNGLDESQTVMVGDNNKNR